MKAKIIKVGTVETNADGNTVIYGWTFAADGSPIFLSDGHFMGWSFKDLAEIAKRPAEFVEI